MPPPESSPPTWLSSAELTLALSFRLLSTSSSAPCLVHYGALRAAPPREGPAGLTTATAHGVQEGRLLSPAPTPIALVVPPFLCLPCPRPGNRARVSLSCPTETSLIHSPAMCSRRWPGSPGRWTTRPCRAPGWRGSAAALRGSSAARGKPAAGSPSVCTCLEHKGSPELVSRRACTR